MQRFQQFSRWGVSVFNSVRVRRNPLTHREVGRSRGLESIRSAARHSPGEDLALHAIDEHPGIAVRIYNPFRHRADNAVLRQVFNLGDFAHVNHWMQNKALVVDGEAAIVGGRNIADEYFGYGATCRLTGATIGRLVPRDPTYRRSDVMGCH